MMTIQSVAVKASSGAPIPETRVVKRAWPVLGWEKKFVKGCKLKEFAPMVGKYPMAGSQVPNNPIRIGSRNRTSEKYGNILRGLLSERIMVCWENCITYCIGFAILFPGLQPRRDVAPAGLVPALAR